MIKFTKFTHNNEVGKIYELDASNNITSMTIGNLIAANIETVSINNLEEFLPQLYGMTNFNHITAGVNPDNAHMCVKGPTSPGIINRSNKDLPFPNSGDSGLLIIDSDNVDKFPKMPVFADYERVEYTSSGSNITDSEGVQRRGFEGCHTVYSVKDPKDIPRTMEALHKREILNYRGLCKVSAAGTFLERSCVDKMLASPSQPVYFQPTLISGLIQQKEIAYVPGIQEPIDTKKLVPKLTKKENEQYKVALEYYEMLLESEMKQVREQWINSRVDEGQGTVKTLTNSLDHQALESDFIIYTKIGDFTVHEIMSNVKQFHGITCKDPLEPDYGSNTVAKIYCDQNMPYINSNAHGGTKYKLYDAMGVGFGGDLPQTVQVPANHNSLPGIQQSAPITVTLAPDEQLAATTHKALYPSTVPLSDLEWFQQHSSGRGKPLSTYENFKIMMELYGYHVAYDVIIKDVMIVGPKMSHEGDLKDVANLAYIKSLCRLNSLEVGIVSDNLNFMMNDNQINPVVEYINNIPWDGRDRLSELFNTLTLAPDQDPEIAWMMFRKWFMGACRIVQGQIEHFEFVLCLQESKGGSGKTRWFNKLCPAPWQSDGIILDTSDKDLVKQCISNWLIELGELDSSFRKSDVKKLMAFLSKSEDEIRAPYGVKSAKFKRRTAFFGSVNGKNFLADDSGDRRFWPIAVTAINYQHDIDMQQVWAQVNAIPLEEKHYLDTVENKQIINANKMFKALDPIDDLLSLYFSGEVMTKLMGYTSDNRPITGTAEMIHLSTTEILMKSGVERPSKANLNRAAAWLRDSGYADYRTKDKRGFLVKAMVKGVM
jgi:hypothetical protein